MYLKNKEDKQELNEKETTKKISLALKEYAKKQSDFANVLQKFGLL
jgi:hypothetical protein